MRPSVLIMFVLLSLLTAETARGQTAESCRCPEGSAPTFGQDVTSSLTRTLCQCIPMPGFWEARAAQARAQTIANAPATVDRCRNDGASSVSAPQDNQPTLGLILAFHPVTVSFGRDGFEQSGAFEIGLGAELGRFALALTLGTELQYGKVGAAITGVSPWSWSAALEALRRIDGSRMSLGLALEGEGNMSTAGSAGLKTSVLLEIEIGVGCAVHLNMGTDIVTVATYQPGAAITGFSSIIGGAGVECLIPFYK